ncbi:unknown protein 1-like [Magnolia sinica]|uniref:unknown protein 1-like n=1 Tax=Magnolia sinica TaxID=86752 RepID=UPI00265A1889|nr:unknown protein 1-like [Magnolia sinica]
MAEKMEGELDSSSQYTSFEKTEVLETKDAKLSKMAIGCNLAPVTPVADRANREALAGSDTPITWVSSPPIAVTSKSDGTGSMDSDSGIRTPKRRVFDPFAPGPDELMFAPRKKPLEESRTRTMRRLNFESYGDFMESAGENDLEDVHEEKFLESVYESFLDAIVSNQAEGILAENQSLELGFCDGLKTPTSSPFLTGIAETCPGAPMKPAAKARNLLGISTCRKLEF